MTPSPSSTETNLTESIIFAAEDEPKADDDFDEKTEPESSSQELVSLNSAVQHMETIKAALQYLDKGDASSALDRLRLMSQYGPAAISRHLALGIILLNSERFVEAIWNLQQVLNLVTAEETTIRIVALKALATARRIVGHLAEAERLLDQAIDLAPTGELIYSRGEIRSMAGRYEDAIADLDRAIALGVRTQDARQGKALALQQLQQYDEALQELLFILKSTPEDPAALTGCAQVCLQKQDFAEARKYCNQSLEADPEYEPARVCLGDIHLQLKEYDEALSIYRRIINDNSGNVVSLTRAWLGCANAHQAAGQNAQAVDCFTQAAVLYIEAASLDAARRCLDDAIGLDPQNELALSGRAEILRTQEKYIDAEQDLKAISKLSGVEDAWVLGSRAQIYLAQDHLQTAKSEFKRALKLEPDMDWLLGGLGETYLLLREFEKAEAVLHSALQQDPQYVGALMSRAALYRILQRFEESLADIRHVLEIEPNNLEARIRRSNIYRWMGEFELAQLDMDVVRTFDESNVEALMAAAAVKSAQREYLEARDLLKGYLDKHKNDQGARVLLGEALLFLGEFDGACKAFGEALEQARRKSWLNYEMHLVKRKQGLEAEAGKFLQQALELGEKEKQERPDWLRKDFNLALFFLASDRVEEALERYKGLVEKSPTVYAVREAMRDLQDLHILFPDLPKVQDAYDLLHSCVNSPAAQQSLPEDPTRLSTAAN